MILRPVTPASPSGPPISNLPVGLMWIDGLVGDEALGQHVVEDAHHIVVQLGILGGIATRRIGLAEVLLVLGRNDHRGRAHRHFILVAQRHLALGVGLEERRLAAVAVGGHPLEDVVRIIERRRHQVGRLVGRVAEHDALVAGAFVLVAAGIDALRDVAPTAGAGGCRKRRFCQWKPSCS